MTGRFITLEGGEGVGKSTQAAHLAGAIRARGHDVVLTREPGGTPGAEAIRGLLVTGAEDRWSARAEALLFAAARADHVERLIRPALDAGQWVVCDRFVDSTRAYQGGGALPDTDILAMHAIGSGGLLPDRTLLLTLDRPAAIARSTGRAAGDRLEERGQLRATGIEARFAALAAADPARFRAVSTEGAPAAVTARLVAAIEDLL